jgi:pyoverdine/dityrosine biosynthesis protein Dit1
MEISNDGTSIYHRFQGVFLCNLDWKLLYLKGPHQSKIQEDWPTISQRCRNAAVEDEHSHLLPISTHIGQTNGDAVIIYVVRRRDNNALTGIVLDASGTGQAFEKFFARLILDRLDLAIRNPTASRLADRPTQITGQIVDLFDRRLRYSGKADQWAATGRSFFWDRIYHFTSQRARIELCLPAFPCKSSNTQKVTGKDPDRGEELALIRLHEFVDEVQQIYPYGAKIWIISDGHVFSDCIGVDDSDVDDYGQKLQDMNDAIAKGRGHTDQVVFMSLIDIFNLEESIARDQISSLGNLLQLAAVDHHIATNVTPVAEVCRQILMQGCQPQRTALRAKIDSQDASILALYRGFSRFMLEDLEMHPNARYLTRSKQKKLSVKISFEMIMVRNQSHPCLLASQVAFLILIEYPSA